MFLYIVETRYLDGRRIRLTTDRAKVTGWFHRSERRDRQPKLLGVMMAPSGWEKHEKDVLSRRQARYAAEEFWGNQ